MSLNAVPLADFVAAGTLKVVAESIEQVAKIDNVLSALVVPWESDKTTLSIAVTQVKVDGWAIEHTNVGTITVTDLGDELARVAVMAIESDDPDQPKRLSVLGRFAGQLASQLKVMAQ